MSNQPELSPGGSLSPGPPSGPCLFIARCYGLSTERQQMPKMEIGLECCPRALCKIPKPLFLDLDKNSHPAQTLLQGKASLLILTVSKQCGRPSWKSAVSSSGLLKPRGFLG